MDDTNDIAERIIKEHNLKLPKDLFVSCASCTHTENIHDKFDGRSPKRQLECHAYRCDCKNFVSRN